jgi:hypothetical protein
MVTRYKEIKGERFGSLVALEYQYTKGRLAYWKYLCDCGNEHIARANTVKYSAKNKPNPKLPSCGCVEVANKTKHGFRKAKDTHPDYLSWKAIKDRCYNPNVPTYPIYGGKGVTMCDEWINDPKAFVEWSINNGWEKGLVIDKDILSDKLGINPPIYSPQTCQWISTKSNVAYATNRANFGKHSNVKLSSEQVNEILNLYFSGKVTNKSELARMYGVKSPSTIDRLIRLHNTSD